jgi:fido (protein-threonine AMPylation protein)
MQSPRKNKPKRANITSPASSSLPPSSPRTNLAKSIREKMKSTFQRDGCLKVRTVRGIETSFTIAMDDAYDYSIIGELDPDDLHEELLKHTNEVCQVMQNLTPAHDVAVDDYLADILSRLVFGSNMIENAGAGLDVTYKLCQAIFRGEKIPEDFGERDEDYQTMKKDLQRRDLPVDYQFVLRTRREIIHHAEATSYIMNELYLRDQNLTEEIILETHRILTYQINTEQDISWTAYSGVYRQDQVCAGLHSFIPPEMVRLKMRAMIREMNSDLDLALKCGKIDPVAFSAKFCHIFVNIHPFLDGNGRTCRLILNAILLKYGGNLVSIGELGDDREKYMEIATTAGLRESSQSDDLDDDDDFKPKHHRELATFTLKHFTESMRNLVQAIQGKKKPIALPGSKRAGEKMSP